MIFYWSSPKLSDDTLARHAAERALALAPDKWEGHWATGLYYATVAHLPLLAMQEEAQALRISPNNSEVLAALALDARDPQSHYRMFMIHLAQADLPAALAALEIPQDSVAQARALTTGTQYQISALDGPRLRRVSRLELDAFQGVRVPWAFSRSRAFDALGDQPRSRAYADSLLLALRGGETVSPNALRLRRAQVWGLIKVGRRAEALAAAVPQLGAR